MYVCIYIHTFYYPHINYLLNLLNLFIEHIDKK